jgi:PTH1 family peptidyl-tRNA hydrolase
MKASTEAHGDRLHPFLSLDHARETIGALLRPGDLVLLKGTRKDDLHKLLSAGLARPASVASTGSTATAGARPARDSLSSQIGRPGTVDSSPPGVADQAGREEEGALQAFKAKRKALRSRMHALYSSRNALFKQIGAAKRTGAVEVAALQAEAAKLSFELERLDEELEQIQRRIDGPAANETVATPWVVGLGNPDEQFLNTPHNVGQAVVDSLVEKLAGTWVHEGASLVAEVNWNETKVLVIKPVITINNTGRVLFDLARTRQLSPQYCVLVHDDVALPLGTVRSRGKGTDGGHRGVRSILEAFETDAFLRVKIGVATPARLQDPIQGVLTPFAADELKTLVPAYPVACATILDLLHMASAAHKHDGSVARPARQAS